MFKLLLGLAILILIQYGGELIAAALGATIPGPIFGMLGLLLFLSVYGAVPIFLSKTCAFIFPLLPLLIVPTSVGMITFKDSLQHELLAILLALTISCTVSFFVTPFVLQFFIRRSNQKQTTIQ